MLLLDQVPRNCFRGADAKTAFTVFDPVSIAVTLRAIRDGIPDAPELRYRPATASGSTCRCSTSAVSGSSRSLLSPAPLQLPMGPNVCCDSSRLTACRVHLQSLSGTGNGEYLGDSAPGDPDDLTARSYGWQDGTGRDDRRAGCGPSPERV